MSPSSPSPAVAPARGIAIGIACGLLAAVIWGVQAVVSRQSVADGLSAADVTILRFLVAALLLLPFGLKRMRPFPVGRLGWRRSLILTAMVGAPYSLLLITGSLFAPALHASLVGPGLIPVVTAGLAYLALGEKATRARLLGLAVIICGIGLFSWAGAAGGPEVTTSWIGDLIYVLTATIWSAFGLLARRWRANATDVTIVTCLLSVPMLPVLLMLSPSHLLTAKFGAIALQALYQGAVVGVGALFFYTQAVAALGAARAALFLPLVPAVTAFAGFAILGERASGLEIAGMALAIAGMVMALRAPSAA